MTTLDTLHRWLIAPAETEHLELRVVEKLRLRIEATELAHANGRVLVFEVPTRPVGLPLDFEGTYRVCACYQHCCLQYMSNSRMSNQSLRERFRLGEAKTNGTYLSRKFPRNLSSRP